MAENEPETEGGRSASDEAEDDEYGQNQYGGDESVDAVEQTERMEGDDEDES